MPAKKDSFLDQLDIVVEVDSITITKKRRRNITALVAGIIITPLLLLWGMSDFFGGGFIFVLIAIYAGYNAWRSNSSGTYPKTIFDFTNSVVTRKSNIPLIKDDVRPFTEVRDLGFGVKAVGGHTSAYEEGNTDYRKTLILETDAGDIRLCNYRSRNQDLEESVSGFATILREKLGLTKTSE